MCNKVSLWKNTDLILFRPPHEEVMLQVKKCMMRKQAMFTRAHLPGLARISLEWHARSARMNREKTKPFQIKLALLDKTRLPVYAKFGSLCLMLYERKAMPHRA